MRLYAALVFCIAGAGCSFQARAAMTTGDGSGSADAAVDATLDASDDLDGDGVPNELDNCPTMANANQRDHDVDGRGDVCDLCPHIAELADVDSDGDGVGDACDPRPTMPGDSRAYWDGFYDANDISNWAISNTASVSLGRFVVGSTTAGFQYAFPNVTFTNAYAVTNVRLTAVGGLAGTTPALEVQLGNNTTDQTYSCIVDRTTATADDFWPGQAEQATAMPWTGTFAANSDFGIANEVAGPTHRCLFAQAPMTKVLPTQSAGPHVGYVLLGAHYATAAYDYLFVVEMGQ